MKARLLGSLAVSLLGLGSLACGGEASSDDGASAGADDGAGGGGAGGGGGGEPSDPTAPPGLDCESFEVNLANWTVAPGENTDYCMRLPIPERWNGEDMALTGWSWNLSSTHHFFMEHSPQPFPGTGTEPIGCGTGEDPRKEFSFINSANNEGSVLAFGAGQGTGTLHMANNVGKYLPKGGHFRTSHHVINSSDQPIDTWARFNVCVQPLTQTEYVANTMVCTSTAIDVPAGTVGSTVGTCTAPYDMEIVLLASHAHNHLTRFTVQKYDGTATEDALVYESTDWDSPNIIQLADKPILLKAGQGLTYTCEYEGEARFSAGAEEPWAEHCGLFTAYTFARGQGKEYEVPGRLTGLQTAPGAISVAFPSLAQSPI
ncbi:MAG: hypothetical protein FJ104_12590 [Deltaproteobacteria bacterium]|nr:hypothetical protein [Deltaproteobacteria bacterium]